MSTLSTYNIKTSGMWFTSQDGKCCVDELAPGSIIIAPWMHGTYGILISRNDEEFMILWSVVPSDDYVDVAGDLAREISDEIDAEIFRDMRILNNE